MILFFILTTVFITIIVANVIVAFHSDEDFIKELATYISIFMFMLAMLNYGLSNGVVNSHNDERKSLIADKMIVEHILNKSTEKDETTNWAIDTARTYNETLRANKKMCKNIWVGCYYNDKLDDLEYIELR